MKQFLSSKLILVCLLWAAVVFAIDLSVPSDVAVAVPYIGLVMMGLWLPHRYYIHLAAAGGTLLTLLGFLYTDAQSQSMIVLTNRFIAVLAIWGTAIFCILYKKEETILKKTQGELEKRVIELQELKNKFENFAKTDPLTELPNRRGMDNKLQYEQLRFKRTGRPFCLVLSDIDFFKKINDTYGHDAGDQILIQVAEVMKSVSRRTDVVCRWGGEEFLALLPDTDLKGGITLAEKLRIRIEEEVFHYEKTRIPVTMSFGVTVFDSSDSDLDLCIKHADECLYKAKEAGRNKVIAFQAGKFFGVVRTRNSDTGSRDPAVV